MTAGGQGCLNIPIKLLITLYHRFMLITVQILGLDAWDLGLCYLIFSINFVIMLGKILFSLAHKYNTYTEMEFYIKKLITIYIVIPIFRKVSAHIFLKSISSSCGTTVTLSPKPFTYIQSTVKMKHSDKSQTCNHSWIIRHNSLLVVTFHDNGEDSHTKCPVHRQWDCNVLAPNSAANPSNTLNLSSAPPLCSWGEQHCTLILLPLRWKTVPLKNTAPWIFRNMLFWEDHQEEIFMFSPPCVVFTEADL